MAFLGQTFDASQVEPSQSFEVIPPGEYVAHIVASEMKPTSKGGQMLVLDFEIIDGEHQSRKLWDRLNLMNDNPKAVDIAQRTLSAICHSIGKMTVSDSDDLHFQPMTVVVEVEPEKTVNGSTYKAKNVIKGYKSANNGATRPAAQQAAIKQASPAPSGGSKPWQRKAAS